MDYFQRLLSTKCLSHSSVHAFLFNLSFSSLFASTLASDFRSRAQPVLHSYMTSRFLSFLPQLHISHLQQSPCSLLSFVHQPFSLMYCLFLTSSLVVLFPAQLFVDIISYSLVFAIASHMVCNFPTSYLLSIFLYIWRM